MIYFCSDIHWGHDRIARLRGFDTVHDWNQHVMNELKQLRRDDILYVLGDIALNTKHMETVLDVFANVCPARDIRFVWGNHDPGHTTSAHPNKKFARRAYETFSLVSDHMSRNIAGYRVLLSHYPYDTVPPQHDHDTLDVTRRLYRLPDHGYPLVHGHTHVETLHLLPYTYNVCYEATGRLLTPETTIAEWVEDLAARGIIDK